MRYSCSFIFSPQSINQLYLVKYRSSPKATKYFRNQRRLRRNRNLLSKHKLANQQPKLLDESWKIKHLQSTVWLYKVGRWPKLCGKVFNFQSLRCDESVSVVLLTVCQIFSANTLHKTRWLDFEYLPKKVKFRLWCQTRPNSCSFHLNLQFIFLSASWRRGQSCFGEWWIASSEPCQLFECIADTCLLLLLCFHKLLRDSITGAHHQQKHLKKRKQCVELIWTESFCWSNKWMQPTVDFLLVGSSRTPNADVYFMIACNTK